MLEGAKYIKEVPFSSLFNWSVQYLNETKISFNSSYPMVSIGSFLTRNKTSVTIENGVTYKRVTIKVRNGGVVQRDSEIGDNIGTKRQYKVSEGQFILSKIDARNGAMGLIPSELEGAIVTQDFLPYDLDTTKINPQYLVLVSTTKEFVAFCQTCSSGTTNRQRVDEAKFLGIKIPLPTIEEQNKLVADYNKKMALAAKQESQALTKEQEIEEYIFDKLGITVAEQSKAKGLRFIAYKDLLEWGLDKINTSENSASNYKIVNLNNYPSSVNALFRGKSPKYKSDSSSAMLNQKCVRWNAIDLQWVKTVDDSWISNINSKFFTATNDILINSTGEGTIGRAAVVTNGYEGLLYDSHVLLLRLNTDIVNPQYYVELFNSSYGQRQVNNIKSAQSTKQTELGTSNLQKIEFPLPPIEIQNEIATHISGLKQEIKKLRTTAESNRKAALTNFEQKIF